MKKPKKQHKTNRLKHRATHNSPYFLFKNDVYNVQAGEKELLYPHMLNPILSQLEAIESYYSNIIVIRFDITFCEGEEAKRETIDTLQRRLFRRLKTNYKLKRIGYVWAREKEKAKNHHYHYALFLDGNRVNNTDYFFNLVTELCHQLNLSPHFPTHNYYKYKTTTLEGKKEAVHRLSYLAKTRGKGYRDKQEKDYGISRIK